MEPNLSAALERAITKVPVEVRFASGQSKVYGGDQADVCVRFGDAQAERAVAMDPGLQLPEMYMEGRLQLVRGDIFDLISALKRNGMSKLAGPRGKLLELSRTAATFTQHRLLANLAKKNVAHHYDLNEELFRLFLDTDLNYSCAYFETPDQSLEAAQRAKLRHVSSKLKLRAKDNVLDIGCGWGSLAMYIAKVCGSKVTGITLSKEQLSVANRRAKERGLQKKVNFELADYSTLHRRFDRIVSVGMFEHVGKARYAQFFETTAKLLDKRGLFLLHSIGRNKPAPTSAFMEKYIFPGSHMPALSEVLPHVEAAGFIVKDIEYLPLHYARTLREWRKRFVEHRSNVVALYDERFFRMWEFYLAVSEAGFLHDRLFVFQMQLAKHLGAVPKTRDYMQREKQKLLQKEAKAGLEPLT